MATITGKITRVYASKGSWSSCYVSCDSGDSICCVGTIPGAVIGMRIKAEGDYVNHPKFGAQFEVKNCELEVAYTKEYAARYLHSGAVKGIGPETARKIIDKFGDDTMRIIEGDDYRRLSEIDGIGKRTAKKIHEAYNENSTFRKLLGYANLSLGKADKLYKRYAEKALDMVKNHPYQIIYDIDGFGFKTVDEIALKNGWDENHPDRIAAAITYQLTRIGENGHCFCSIDALEQNLNELIPSVSNKVRSEVLINEIKNRRVILETGNTVYSKRLFMAERTAAEYVAKLVKNSTDPLSQKLIDKAIRDMEREVGFELESQQKNAVSTALRNKLSIITGGPGTGKSTIVNAIVKGWLSQYDSKDEPSDHVVLCAPTGKASRRMSDVTGIFAETVQRIIMHQSESEDPITDKLIIVDESSMLDILLAKSILKIAAEGNNRIVFIGDANQLPPIGPGNFFRDLIGSPCVPSVTLELCHRQTGTIALNAKKINDGRSSGALDFSDPSCRFIYAKKENARDTVLEEYRNLLTLYGVREICILVPMRKAGRSHTSADELNSIIREEINPSAPDDVVLYNCEFRKGDRVMYTANDYEKGIFNGDCGIVEKLDTEFELVVIELDDGRTVELTVAQAKSLMLAYAITVHKSQGSEYKGVIIVQNREHAFMLQRNLLYTAITRAKEQAVIVGEPAAINIAVNKIPSLERQTKLRVRIGEAIAVSK